MRARARCAGILALALAALVAGCARRAVEPLLGAESANVAYGRKAMVATADERASDAGLAMLEKGGNAVDAFAAASFAISVTRPQSTGIGGGGFAVLRLRDGAGVWNDYAVDFRERAPGAARRDMFLDSKLPKDASLVGPLAVGVPGTVAGVLSIHERFGRLSRAEVLAPAIRLAADGFPVYPGLATSIERSAAMLSRYPASAAIFLPGGRPLAAGETLRQADLARTLEAIAQRGPEAFYKGPIAEAMAAEVDRLGGVLSAQDLERYRVIARDPMHGRYRDLELIAMPPPSSGGVLMLEMINMISARDSTGLPAKEPDRVHLLAEVMRRAYEDRAEYLGDPDFVAVPVDRLISPTFAAERMWDFDPEHVTPRAPTAPRPLAITSTTHISIIDGAGDAVAATESVNYIFGSGIVVPGTGVLLNDTMDDFATRPGVPNAYGLIGNDANAIAPGKTPLSSMSPTILARDGTPVLVAGSPGGSLIITATLQTMLNVVDRKMSLGAAVAAPRIHHQALPNQLNYEQGAFDAKTAAELERRGHVLKEAPAMGNVQAVQKLPTGMLVGASDPRAEGRPAGR